MTEERKPFDSFAIVEVMGHRQYAGHVTEEHIGGVTLLRIDIPATSKAAEHTKYVGGGGIFQIHPCSEDVARAAAERFACQYGYSPLPVSMPTTRALPAGVPADDEDSNPDWEF